VAKVLCASAVSARRMASSGGVRTGRRGFQNHYLKEVKLDYLKLSISPFKYKQQLFKCAKPVKIKLKELAMKIELFEKPKNPIIIEGFPGFGFVATIATEYLLDHLNFKSIGRIWSEDLPPLAVIHNKKVIQPLEIFYNPKNNIVLLQALSGVAGLEWEVANVLISLYKKLDAKELISIEGIGSPVERTEPAAYFHTTIPGRAKKFEEIGVFPLEEGIVLGVSGALMLSLPKEIKATFIFAETHSKLPDSRAAAKIIEVLDKYLNLKVDYKPLIKRAAEFEEKLKRLLERTREAAEEKKKKEFAPYVG